jgi:hypothetical protein
LHCGSSQHAGPEPEVALASSAEAQARFRALRQQWVSSPLDARVALERGLTDFVQHYPSDPQGRWVRLYLAWISVQRNELDDAERWLALADPGSAGSANDLSGVVRAALQLSKGEAEPAYRSLLALSGRLIDADDRLLCLDQLVLAALADRRYQAAVLHMLELSAQAARRHRERLWRTLEPRLASVPLRELEASLPKLTPDKIQNPSVQPAERRAAVDWMRRTLLDLLSRSAIDEQDVALAQRLVASPRAEADDEKSELLLLATRGTLEATVSGRTLGFALDLADPARSQRSIDVAAGIALTLDLSAPAKDSGMPVLSTRQIEKGNMADTLARLAGDGASLLVAGLDAESARAAADFAAASGAPVLLLHEPAGQDALPASAFVLGAHEAEANDVLFAALEQRFRGVVRVGTNGATCPSGDAEVDALVARASTGGRRPRLQFDADPSCARGVLMHFSDGERPLALGFGLDALGVAWDAPPADEVWAVGAGRLPRFDGARDALATRWFTNKGRAPTWYEGLGHDAALVAALALNPAPAEPVRDAGRVRAIYGEVAQRLAAERWPELWTSENDRFDAKQRLPRGFRAERVSTAPAESAR